MADPARAIEDGRPSPPPGRPTFPVQAAKAQRPPLRPDTLHRARLLEWLAINVHHRLVQVVADAGYGKTTLLADFAAQTRLRTIWFRVDDEDRDWISVLHYLVAAGREVDPGFAPHTAERLAELGTTGGTRQEIVRTFLAELGRLADDPTVLIIDDYHVLDESPDARSVIADILVRAPERFTLILATRRRPSLTIARLRALGEVADLTTDDLRFTEPETEALFRDAYHQPLEPDVLSDLSRRTEGWAASLQLVRAAVRERSTSQIRAFVRSLSGVDENLYDYLAEEVVGELEPAMQDFLMRTSILQVVDPTLAEVVASVPQPDARRLIESAERIGLLSRRGQTARHTVRYHPLVRDFLEDRLRRDTGDDAVRDLHRVVARHGETSDWRLAAFHYTAARDIPDLHRVLREWIHELLGRGDVRLAHEYLTGFPPTQPDPVFDVIESRLHWIESRLSDAQARAQAAYEHLRNARGTFRDIALFNLVSVQFERGFEQAGFEHAKLLAETAEDPGLRSIGIASILMAEATEADLHDLAAQLESMVRSQRTAGHWQFLATSLANLAFTYRQMGDADRTRDVAREALEAFPADTDSPVVAAAESVLAWALRFTGEVRAAEEASSRATSSPHVLVRVESLVESADLETWYGDAAVASRLLTEAVSIDSDGLRSQYLGSSSAELAIRTGDFDTARTLLANEPRVDVYGEVGHLGRRRYMDALLAARTASPFAPEAIQSALMYCRRRHISFLVQPLVLLAAAVRGGDALTKAVAHWPAAEAAHLSMVAELVVDRLDAVDTFPGSLVEREVRLRPARWLPPLRLALRERGPSANAAAHLLDLHGDQSDVSLLRGFVRAQRRAGIDPGLGRRLARRLAAKVVVEDLGRIRVVVGDKEILGTRIRRKSLALLCLLLTRQ
ncbi:MAG TPA: hypothetical protein VFI28_02155, partial [Candidatus Limnocylindrales bacterium]|nr:hypothetical protein [Candidatus Limnocylindrales bacterium]